MSEELNNAQSALRIAGKHAILDVDMSMMSKWDRKVHLAVAAIEVDLRDRAGIKRAFEGLDDGVMESIRETWRAIVSMAMG